MTGKACPRCGAWLTYEEIGGMGEAGTRGWFLLGLFNLLFAWVVAAVASQSGTGYCRCFRCGYRWRCR